MYMFLYSLQQHVQFSTNKYTQKWFLKYIDCTASTARCVNQCTVQIAERTDLLQHQILQHYIQTNETECNDHW